MLLAVSVPSHCDLMRGAAEKLAVELGKASIMPPKIPVVHNATVESYNDPDAIRSALVAQLYSPVRWVETVVKLSENGVDHIYECGPGKVLTGLVRRIDANVSALALEKMGGFKEALSGVN